MPERGKVYIGTSGFTCKSWNADFYPPELPQRLQLENFATQFQTVEINATFHRLPAEAMIRRVPRRTRKATLPRHSYKPSRSKSVTSPRSRG